MIDTSRKPGGKKRDPLPAFLPVPRQCNRHDGWTPERQRRFIEALADTGSVRAAAHAVNMTPEGAYLLRRHPEGGAFRKAWEAALKLGVQRLEDVAMERALNGVEVPVYHFGAVVGTRRIYNDRLLMFLLRNRATKRFKADGWQQNADAVTRQQLAKLKTQWQNEWQAEQDAKAPSREQVRASIDRKIAAMRRMIEADLENCSPRTRRLKDAYERSRQLDDQRGGQREEAEWEDAADSPDAPPTATPAAAAAENQPAPAPTPTLTGPRIRSPRGDGWR